MRTRFDLNPLPEDRWHQDPQQRPWKPPKTSQDSPTRFNEPPRQNAPAIEIPPPVGEPTLAATAFDRTRSPPPRNLPGKVVATPRAGDFCAFGFCLHAPRVSSSPDCLAAESAMPRIRTLNTPTGPFYILQHDDGGLETGWVEMAGEMGRISPKELAEADDDDALLPEFSARLLAAFNGEEIDFTDLDTPPGTPFQRVCWRSTRKIPHGETRSYAQLAKDAGHPGAARAVGQAMRRNPLPMVVPCHRVVAQGGLGGFGGEGSTGSWASIKGWLLQAEGVDVPAHSSAPTAAMCQ